MSELRSDIVIPPAPSGHHSGVTAARADVVRYAKVQYRSRGEWTRQHIAYRDGTRRDNLPKFAEELAVQRTLEQLLAQKIIPNSGNRFLVSSASRADRIGPYFIVEGIFKSKGGKP
jgi:hypothetical protein